jgi:hypothetical protein
MSDIYRKISLYRDIVGVSILLVLDLEEKILYRSKYRIFWPFEPRYHGCCGKKLAFLADIRDIVAVVVSD